MGLPPCCKLKKLDPSLDYKAAFAMHHGLVKSLAANGKVPRHRDVMHHADANK